MVIAGVRPHKARPAPQGDSTTLSARDGLGTLSYRNAWAYRPCPILGQVECAATRIPAHHKRFARWCLGPSVRHTTTPANRASSQRVPRRGYRF